MGSNRFYEDQMKPEGVHAALVMDLVGHDVCFPAEYVGHVPGIGSMLGKIPGLADKDINVPFLSNLLFMTGTESHQGLIDIVGEQHSPKGLKVLPTLNSYIGDMSDHGVFRENGVPYLFLSCGHWQHYHQAYRHPRPPELQERWPTSPTMPASCSPAWMSKTCHVETGSSSTRPCRWRPASSRKVLGPAHNIMLKQMGIDGIEEREDMNRFASKLMSAGL